MAVISAAGRLAARAPAPTYPVIGAGMRAAVQRLRLDSRVTLVDSPRHATVLLVAGALPESQVAAAVQTHDALPRPRGTVWWGPPGGAAPQGLFDCAEVVGADDDVAGVLARVHGELVTGGRPGEVPLLADEDPVAWRGEGPYGHGGTGMTGGTPYGRPLAERADDRRDALKLDVVPITVGPNLAFLPPGLALRVVFNGDLVHDLEVAGNPFADLPADRSGGDTSAAAPGADAPLVADVERRRARHLLRWLAWALHTHGLAQLGVRALRIAEDADPRPDHVDRLAAAVRRSGLLRWRTRGIGAVAASRVAGGGFGPVARASGVAQDARSDDPAYLALGFEPVTHERGDAAARWRQRLAEARQGLELAGRAGDVRVAGRPEPPHGTPQAQQQLLDLLAGLVVGQEWSDAIAVLVSLDLDLELAAAPLRTTAGGAR